MEATPVLSRSPAVTAVGSEAPPMRAIVQTGYGGSDVLRLASTARPAPGEAEVLVEVKAAGLDRGTWHLMTGRPYLMRLMGFGFWRPKQPVAGLDLAGTVVAVGAKVTRFRPGDHVFGIGAGSFAEYAVAREDKLALKPAALGFEQAAVLGVSGLTALQALRAGGLQAGERVLVIGASGGVGSYAVQLAKSFGAQVTGVCSAGKQALVRRIGADHVIDYQRGDFADGSIEYDLILDIAGNTPLSRLRRALTPTGRLVFVGNEHGGDFTAGFGRPLWAFALAPFVKQRFSMLMSNEHFTDLEELARLADARRITPAIDRVCVLSELVRAIGDLEAGRVAGKVVVLPT